MTPTPTTPATPAIDFAAIRSRCPRAFAALIGWLANVPMDDALFVILKALPETIERLVNQVIANPRDLYDFFDEQGLFVVVRTQGIALPPVWAYELECEGSGVYQGNYPTRAAAEAAAFTAGFEKLEQMFNQKEG